MYKCHKQTYLRLIRMILQNLLSQKKKYFRTSIPLFDLIENGIQTLVQY